MTLIDFLIGFFLMNAMPHFVLGTWQARMFSGFGFGHLPNKLYGLLNALISLSLFVFTYGIAGFQTHGIYLGAVAMLMIYFASGWFWFKLFNKPTTT